MHPIVASAIKKLVQSGKTPTVALTKSKLSQPVAMPEIIAAIAAYKQDPSCVEQLHEEPAEHQVATQTQLDRIEAKLDRLLALLEKS